MKLYTKVRNEKFKERNEKNVYFVYEKIARANGGGTGVRVCVYIFNTRVRTQKELYLPWKCGDTSFNLSLSLLFCVKPQCLVFKSTCYTAVFLLSSEQKSTHTTQTLYIFQA